MLVRQRSRSGVDCVGLLLLLRLLLWLRYLLNYLGLGLLQASLLDMMLLILL